MWQTAYKQLKFVNLFSGLCILWNAESVLHHKAFRDQWIKCYFRNISWCVWKKYSQLYIAWHVSWCVAKLVIARWLREDLRERNSIFRGNYLGWFQTLVPFLNSQFLITQRVETLWKNLRLRQGILFESSN